MAKHVFSGVTEAGIRACCGGIGSEITERGRQVGVGRGQGGEGGEGVGGGDVGRWEPSSQVCARVEVVGERVAWSPGVHTIPLPPPSAAMGRYHMAPGAKFQAPKCQTTQPVPSKSPSLPSPPSFSRVYRHAWYAVMKIHLNHHITALLQDNHQCHAMQKQQSY